MTQPTHDEEVLLDDIYNDTPTDVMIRGKKFSVRWLKAGTRRRLTSMLLKSGDETKVSCKAASLIVLNGYFKIMLLHWLLWRWYYYVRQYGEEELTELIATAKKKIPLRQYWINTTLLTAMRDTMMMMTRAEVSAFRPELSGGSTEKSAKSGLG